MKIIFGILASSGEDYQRFRDIWIQNIRSFKSTSNRDHIDFYFIYHEPTGNLVQKCDGFVNYFWDNTHGVSMMDSFVQRSISLMEYISKDIGEPFDYFIRTNLSTLFDFNSLLEWTRKVPRRNFIAGSVIDNIRSKFTTLSGTNIVLTPDLVDYIIRNKSKLVPECVLEGDDQRLSNLVIANVDVDVMLLKRIDFIEMNIGDRYISPTIIFQSSHGNLSNVFCFRFKTFCREKDITYMKRLQKDITSVNYNLYDSLASLLTDGYYTDYRYQNPDYEGLTVNLFRLT